MRVNRLYELLLAWKYRRVLYLIPMIVLISPFILLSFFTHPAGDDYYFFDELAKNGFWPTQQFFYTQINGRFISSFLISAYGYLMESPLGYNLVTCFILIFFIYATYCLVKSLGVLNDNFNSLAVSLLLVCTILYYMESTAEAFYWITSAITYTFASCLSLIFWAVLLHDYSRQKTFSLKTIVASLLLVFVMGSSDIVALQTLLILISILLYSLVKYKRVSKNILYFTILAMIVGYISFQAPVNSVRASWQGDPQVNHDLLVSTIYTIRFLFFTIVRWLINPVFILLSLVYFFNIKLGSNVKKAPFFNIHPIIGILVMIGLLAACVFPIYWNVLFGPPPRIYNTFIITLVFCWIYNLHVIRTYLSNNDVTVKPLPYKTAFIIWSLVIMTLSVPSNFRYAFKDLFTGTASRYDSELSLRYKLLRNSPDDTVYVAPLKNKPTTIFFRDLDYHEYQEGKFYPYQSYFGKKRILMRDSTAP